jgi:LysM repeat protein
MFQPKSPADLSAILTPEDRVANRPAVPTPPLAASSPGSKTNAAAVQWVKYTVKANESLGAIAKANGCQLVDLAKTNNISNLDLIKEGEEILIPSRNSSHTRVPE